MDLSSIVDEVAALDDEQLASVNEINRSFDALERAVLPVERFGIGQETLGELREGLAQGLAPASAFEGIGLAIRDRIVRDMEAEAEKIVLLVREQLETVPARQTRLGERLRDALDRARGAFEEIGRLRHLQGRRAGLEARLADLRRGLSGDGAGLELLDLALAARRAAAARSALDPRAFLSEAEQAARDDGQLAGIAANARALRDAIAAGRPTEGIGEDLVERVVSAAVRLDGRRADLRRELARIEQAVEKRQELSHGLFQAVTLASEVLERTGDLERRLESQGIGRGSLGPLKAACVAQGLVSFAVDLSTVRVDGEGIDRAASTLSHALGEVLTRLAQHPDEARRLASTWDEMASVDPATLETEWSEATREALSLVRDSQRLLGVRTDHRALLAAADSLDPWKSRLLARLADRAEVAARLPRRLAGTRELLETLSTDTDRAVREAASRALPTLDAFVQAAREALERYHDDLLARIVDPDGGFEQVAQGVAAFGPLAHLPADAMEEANHPIIARTLADVRALFTRLETQVLGASGSATSDLRQREDETVGRVIELQRELALVLARLRRLDQLLFPSLADACREALALARSLRSEGATGAARDALGEALEALHVDAQALRALTLPVERDHGVLADLARRRRRRLLELSEASLDLLFRLLARLAAEHDELSESERDEHVTWMEELLAHARDVMSHHASQLEEDLAAQADAEGVASRFAATFDAYHAWAHDVAESEAGMELVERHGASAFEALEEPFARLGELTLAHVDTRRADWRATTMLENAILLVQRVRAHVASRPTQSDLAGHLEAQSGRLEAAKAELLARIESENPTPSSSAAEALFGTDPPAEE